MGGGGQRHAPVALPPGKTRYPLNRKLGGPPGPVWTVAENLAPTGIRPPNRPASSESLYGLIWYGTYHMSSAVIILSDNYRMLLPVGSVIILM